MAVPVRRSGRGQQIKLEEVVDFTGGLNLAADRFKLAPNESPDMLNIEVDRRGGFNQRRAVKAMNTTAIQVVAGAYDDPSAYTNAMLYDGTQTPVLSMWTHDDEGSGTAQVMAHCGQSIWKSTGGNFTDTALTVPDAASPIGAATLEDLTYVGLQRGAMESQRWNGAAWAPMSDPDATAYQDDYTAPSGSHMPKARLVAAHNSMLWCAYTEEGGVEERNRVRWSHPGDGGSWRTNDWIDVDPGSDGDSIVAIVPFRDHLLVFKHRSVHAIFGYDADTFQRVKLSDVAGACSQTAVAATPMGVFFFSAHDGLYVYDGQSVQWMFEKLKPVLTDGTVDTANLQDVHVGSANGRVWVSVPWTASGYRSFVWDRTTGAWEAFDLGLAHFTTAWFAAGVRFLAVSPIWSGAVDVDVDQEFDEYGVIHQHIDSYYQTGWFDGGSPFVPKRWRRPEFIVKGGENSTITIDVYRNYDLSYPYKSLSLGTLGVSPLDGVWGSSLWGVGHWAMNIVADFDQVLRGGSVGGVGRSIALKFVGPTTDVGWQVDAFTLKYLPRPPRS